MVAFQRVRQIAGGDALNDGEPAVDEGRVRVEEEGTVDACDTSDSGADDRTADEAAEQMPTARKFMMPPPAETFQYEPQSAIREKITMKRTR